MLGDEKGMICIPNESGWMKTGAWYDVTMVTRIWIHLLQITFSHKNPSFLKDHWQGKYDEDYYHHHDYYYYDGDTVAAHLHASKSSTSQSL